MSEEHLARWPDLLVIVINLGVLVAIGVYCARKTRSADDYFLANRSMPGWVVAFSIMATIISSMTFLAIPGATFKDDWRFVPAQLLYFIPALLAYWVFMPFFRQGHIRSAYEYLEQRFGTWARLYGAVAFLGFHVFRTGIILYVVSLPFQKMSGLDLPWVIAGLGILVAAYTIAGGLQAVIYTDLIQGIALIAGGLIVTPIIAAQLPGGFGQILSEAAADGKFGVGNTNFFDFDKKTVWVIILVYQFQFLQILCTDQSLVQRYLAMKTDKDARQGLILGTCLTIPVWIYFAFVGTALYVFYQHFPTTALDGTNPEEVFPYFILTKIPAGVAGFVIAGLLAAAMSTLDSSINASASTVTTDFYRRFNTRRSEQHYLGIGRWASVLFSVIMVGVALVIHFARTETLMDLQTVVYPIVSAGLLSLFLLGFLTVRVGSVPAMVATAATVLLVVVWVVLTTTWGKANFSTVNDWLPNVFWIGVLPNLFLLAVGYGLSLVWPRRNAGSLKDLTIWTRS
jgi:SSS family solute:Na+ symporter